MNFGILPLEFINREDYDKIEQDDVISFINLKDDVKNRNNIKVKILKAAGVEPLEIETKHSLSERQIEILLKGGIINEFKARLSNEEVNAVDENTVTGNQRHQVK